MEPTVRDFHTDGPWIRVDIANGRLSILCGEDGETGPWDVEYESETGERYLASIATIDDIVRLMKDWKSTGECLGGRYFWMSDLIIVDELNAVTIADVVEDLVKTREIKGAMTRAEDDET